MCLSPAATNVSQEWVKMEIPTTDNYPSRAYTQGVYDPIGDQLIAYGGATCALPENVNGSLVWPRCTLVAPYSPGDPSPFIFWDTTVVLQLSGASGPAWREHTAREQVDQSQYPPSCGYCVSVYDSVNHAMILWTFWPTPYQIVATLPLYRLDLSTWQWSVLPLNLTNTAIPRVTGFISSISMIFYPKRATVILYLPYSKQVLVYDTVQCRWVAPPEAQHSAPGVYICHIMSAVATWFFGQTLVAFLLVHTLSRNIACLRVQTTAPGCLPSTNPTAAPC